MRLGKPTLFFQKGEKYKLLRLRTTLSSRRQLVFKVLGRLDGDLKVVWKFSSVAKDISFRVPAAL